MGQRIKTARETANLNQTQAAERAGVSQPYWCMLENDERTPTYQTLRKIAAALGVKVAELAGDD